MTTIPGISSIQLPQIKPSTDVAVAPTLRTGQAGEALAGFGDAVSRQADSAVAASDQLSYAQARSAFLQSETALKSSLAQDQDWSTLPQRYQDGASKALSDAAATITNTPLKARFLAESGVDVANGTSQVQQQAFRVRSDQGVATLDSTLEGNRQAALANPAQANSLIQASSDAITAARSNNFITATEAQQRQQLWAENFGKGYLATLPAAERLKVLTGSDSVAPQPGAVSAGDIHTAIVQQESGGNPNAPTSINGAVGAGQITPDTWKQYAKPGEDINNPKDNAAVSARIVDDLSNKFGGDPARVAVGYFSGPGNVAPAGSATPWIKDARDGNGKSTSSYVADVVGRLGATGAAAGVGAAAAPNELVALAKTNTPADFVPLDVRSEMAREAARQVKEDGALNRQQVASTFDDDVTWLRSGGDPSRITSTPAALMNSLGPVDGARAVAQLSDAQRYGADVKSLALAPQSQVDQILKGELPTGPQGFRTQSQNFDDLRSIATARNAALTTDPAGYVVHNDPATANAYQAAQKDPASFALYAQKLNSTYDLMQVPVAMRQLIPQGDAKGVVSKIETGAPSDAAKLLQGLQSTAGKYWPQTFASLAKNGLPAWVQAVSVAAPADQATMIAALQHSTESGFKGYSDVLPKDQITGSAANPSPLDQALSNDEGMKNLQASMTSYGRTGISTFQGVQKAVRTTAMYLMAQQHMTTDAAVTRASSMVSGQFDFMQQAGGPPARLPKGSMPQVQGAINTVLGNLKPDDVQPYKQLGTEDGSVTSSTPQDRADGAYQGAKSAWWLTITGPDGRPMIRAIDPHTSAPVILSNGKTLDLPITGAPTQGSAPIPVPAAQNGPVLSKPVYRADESVQRGSKGADLKVHR